MAVKAFVLLMIFVSSISIGVELMKGSDFGKNLADKIAKVGERLFR